MPSTLLKTSIFLAFLHFTSARPQTQTQAGSFAIGAVDDWASSGNYLIYSCGSEVPDVKNILDLTYLSLQTAMLSTDSAAYKAFFRTAPPSSLSVVLSAIAAGTNITTPSHGSRRPTVVCVNAMDPQIRTFWIICQHSEHTVVIQPPGTAIVFLCPIFFDRNPLPQPTDCGVVNHARTGLIAHNYIAGTQYGFLVQALADIYIRETRYGGKAVGGDVRDENACLALPPSQALMNPSSYAFYVSSKHQPSNPLQSLQREMMMMTLMRVRDQDLRAGCTQFPSRVPINMDRELLAIDGAGGGNLTDVLTNGCFDVGANSTTCPL